MTAPAEPAVSLRDPRVTFLAGRKPVRAVDGVDLTLGRGEVVALIGESGSGKSVTLRALMRLNPERKTRIEGSIRVAGQDVMSLRGSALSRFRGGEREADHRFIAAVGCCLVEAHAVA